MTALTTALLLSAAGPSPFPLLVELAAVALVASGLVGARVIAGRRRRAADRRAFESGRRGGAAVAAILRASR